MEKTAKITRVVFKNEWANPKGGNVYYHDIELDNGDKGSIGTKEKQPAKLNPGNELTYTIENGKIKAVAAPKPFPGGKVQQDPKIQYNGFAHAYAKDLAVAGKIDLKDITAYAKKFYDSMVTIYEGSK